ncbi:extracellular solute-binding protein [Streptomyces sp. NPDC007991]|uniref:sugar ABC transporter substrate-binding protein n=1 Tax=Streptomyces sp. NPDC007991 TaxID=3364803 RepID=UPI0036E38377
MVLRKASTAAMCVTAALVVAGCGRSDTGASSTPTGSVPSGKVTGTITMWAQGGEGEKLPELLKGFEAENPGVKVNVTAIPWADAHAKYQTAIAGGTTPDIAQMGTTWMADFASAFQQVPKEIDTSDVFPGAKPATMVKDATLGVPWYVDTRAIFYRTDLAKKAGYTSPPKTWADFQAMMKAMQSKAGAKWGISPTGGNAGDFFQGALPFVWSAGGSVMNSAGTKWTFDTPQMLAAMKYYQSFYTKGIADPSPSTETGSAEAAFVKGSTPALINGPWEIGAINQAGGKGFDKKYAVMPFPKNQSATSFIGGANLVVFRNSKQSAAAWKLAQYLSKPSVQASWYEITGDLPAAQSAWSDSSLAGDPKLAAFKEQLGDVKAPPNNTAWTQVSAAADEQLERIIKGADPAAALRELQKSADSIGTGD